MFIDTHVHSAGASRCARSTVEEIIDFKIKLGYDGMILTNHVQPWYCYNQEYSQIVADAESEYEKGLEHLEKIGEKHFKFLLGAEITITLPRHSDILIYGDVLPFLKKHDKLCDVTQQTLFEYCKEDGLVMVQAHPRREGMDFLDPSYLSGVEVNCSPRDLATHPAVIDFADKNNLILTCGTDTHFTAMTTRGGMIVPDDICVCSDFAAYLKTTDFTQIRIDDKQFKHDTKR